MECTSEHGSGLLDGLRDVAQATELGALGVGPRQGGHGLDGAQVVLQLQDERLLLSAGLNGRGELALKGCIAACRGQKWVEMGSLKHIESWQSGTYLQTTGYCDVTIWFLTPYSDLSLSLRILSLHQKAQASP